MFTLYLILFRYARTYIHEAIFKLVRYICTCIHKVIAMSRFRCIFYTYIELQCVEVDLIKENHAQQTVELFI